jgi:hypothetical protein
MEAQIAQDGTGRASDGGAVIRNQAKFARG